jgi:hypothetical protein
MPRPPQPRRIQAGEDNLRKRIAVERKERGQGYDALAKLMTEAGCPIRGSALQRIEKGDPPRGVSVDELIALSIVWDVSVAELLIPIELRDQQRGQALAADLAEAERELARALELLHDTALAIDELDDDLLEYVMGHRDQLFQGPPGINGGWSEKPYLWAWHMEVTKLLTAVVGGQRSYIEAMQAAQYDDSGRLLDPRTGDVWGIAFPSLTERSSS